MRPARNFFLAAIAACTASCATPPQPTQATPDWQLFRSRTARHAANFPGPVQERLRETRSAAGSTTYTYFQETTLGNRYFGTTWTQLPLTPGDSQAPGTVLEAASARALQATGGVLLTTRKTTQDSVEGRQYVIDQPKDRMRVRQQIYVVGDRLVDQTYHGPVGTETDADAERFFASLALLP